MAYNSPSEFPKKTKTVTRLTDSTAATVFGNGGEAAANSKVKIANIHVANEGTACLITIANTFLEGDATRFEFRMAPNTTFDTGPIKLTKGLQVKRGAGANGTRITVFWYD